MTILKSKLEISTNFDEVFEVVKRSVENTLGVHRAGLTLVLAQLPNYIGAYHIVGSNLIVMNRTILSVVESAAKNRSEINAFVYSILIHEYLHSLGYYKETEVRRLAREVSEDNLGNDHRATQMASGNFWDFYPELKNLTAGRTTDRFEIISDFDKSSMPYIG